jgi:hypothetical protein
MATQPKPPPKPEPDDDPSTGSGPPAAATSQALPPEPSTSAQAPVQSSTSAQTIADEQRERSAEIEAMGVEAWKDKHDQRTPEQKQSHPVAGVAPTTAQPEAGSWAGSTRSTPEARKAQNRTAP